MKKWKSKYIYDYVYKISFFIELEDYESALHEVNELINMYPDEPYGYLLKSRIFYYLQDIQSALINVNIGFKILELDNTTLFAYGIYLKVIYYFIDGDINEAYKYFTIARIYLNEPYQVKFMKWDYISFTNKELDILSEIEKRIIQK